MGIYLNPNNGRFLQAVNSRIYVDKSPLIAFTNERIGTEQKNICVSRPRRFGKSINLAMLAAYYSKGCDSRDLFAGLSIASSDSYSKHLNQYNVIYINMQDFLSRSKDIENMLQRLEKRLFKDLHTANPEVDLDIDDGLAFWMEDFFSVDKVPFVILIDEWDCVMREHMNDKYDRYSAYQKIWYSFSTEYV